jgi:dTDP-4-amino-4,6-dideoxygalactose transaminase
MHGYQTLFDFERALAKFTGAPYVVVTDCCTHAIELCFRHQKPDNCAFSAFTYLSIPMLMHKLQVDYRLIPETWTGEYQFHGTNIWDSARRLERNMYREGQMQCISFGVSKPMHLGRGGAILLDDVEVYDILSRMRSDGRDLSISSWEDQLYFGIGYHYCPTLELCEQGLEKLNTFQGAITNHVYPDCRAIIIS